ncbi:MAG TPA: extracellular solute-binding protein [Chloroflexota bacterium]|nr:extracellular solute-binding protein [Chloroflexota bacterium]
MLSLHTSRRLMMLTSLLLVGAVLIAPAATPASASATGTITLKIMHWNSQLSSQARWWTDILHGFTAQHPNVTIENQYVPFDQYLTTLESEAAANTLPDVMYAHVKAAELGRSGHTVDFKAVFPASFFKQFLAGPLRQFTFDNGKVYALPWDAQMFGLFVNDTIMAKLHLKPPQTWNDLIAMAPKIRAAGYTPLAFGTSDGGCPDFFLPLITQYGGDVYGLDDLTKKGLSWNSAPVINAYSLLQRLSQAHVFLDGINGITAQQGEVLAYHGKAAMLFDGSFSIPLVGAPASFAQHYSLAKMPALTPNGRHWAGDGSGDGWAVNAHSPNKALAVALMKYLFSPSVYRAFIKATQSFPSMPSAESAVTDAKVRQMISWVKEGDGTDHILFGKGSNDAVNNACQGVLNGSLSPQQAAAQTQKAVLTARSH